MQTHPQCNWEHTWPPKSREGTLEYSGKESMWILKAQQQIEYYFSDRNLRKDTYLREKTGPLGTEFVELEFLCNFPRLEKLASDSILPVFNLIQMAVEQSQGLELSHDKGSLRRSTSLTADVLTANSRYVGSMLLGTQPNIFWSHVTMDELRCERGFLALPPPPQLKINGPSSWSWIRQDDPLWDEVHWGVLSTRHLRGILGFHEPLAAAFLCLPNNMINHHEAVSAYHDLLEAPEASAYYRWDADETFVRATNESQRGAFNRRLMHAGRSHTKFQRSRATFSSLGQVRCAWGSMQEANALKQLLQAPEIVEAGCTLEEVGLCMAHPSRLAERRSNTSVSDAEPPTKICRWRSKSSSSPTSASQGRSLSLIGASPDAMLRFRSGELAAVEVKNVCPFFDHNGSLAVHHEYVPPESRQCIPHWRLRGPAETLPLAYTPQAQLEMFVTDTRLNYFVSASALQGINVFVIERDDSYIDLMLRVIDDFHNDFVLRRITPTENFFWDRPIYMELLHRTRSLSRNATVSIRIPPLNAEDSSSLFVDSPRQINA